MIVKKRIGSIIIVLILWHFDSDRMLFRNRLFIGKTFGNRGFYKELYDGYLNITCEDIAEHGKCKAILSTIANKRKCCLF